MAFLPRQAAVIARGMRSYSRTGSAWSWTIEVSMLIPICNRCAISVIVSVVSLRNRAASASLPLCF
jgi:hypothetical protein